MGSSSSREERRVVTTNRVAGTTQIVTTSGNALATINNSGLNADAGAMSDRGWSGAKTSENVFYAEASGEGRALATSRGAAARAGEHNAAIAYTSKSRRAVTSSVDSRRSNSNTQVATTAIDNSISYAAVRGNGQAALERKTGRAGVSVRGSAGRASVRREGKESIVHVDGKGAAGVHQGKIWARVGDSVAVVQFSDDEGEEGTCQCGIENSIKTCWAKVPLAGPSSASAVKVAIAGWISNGPEWGRQWLPSTRHGPNPNLFLGWERLDGSWRDELPPAQDPLCDVTQPAPGAAGGSHGSIRWGMTGRHAVGV
ncbi:hypothetical protein QBC39DRAFT_334493 [Podospora conica]|nr:hypothetical protein QBC39DRAFT_334493 [Schizothecium conicum]